MVQYDEAVAHCSNHSSFFAGCGECSTAALFQGKYESKLTKRKYIHPLEIAHGKPGPKLQLVHQQLLRKIYIFLVGGQADVVEAARRKYEELNKLSDPDAILLATLGAIDWNHLVEEIKPDLAEATQIGILDGVTQLELKRDTEEVKSIASWYSTNRSAEMIGKKVVGGKLVDNPNAKYVISETTRDDLKDIIDDAFAKKLSIDEIQKEIMSSKIFSSTRAALIAKTEMSMAQVYGNLEIWRRSGLVTKASVILSDDHNIEDECDNVVSRNPYLINELPFVPIHPNCSCMIRGE